MNTDEILDYLGISEEMMEEEFPDFELSYEWENIKHEIEQNTRTTKKSIR